MNKQIFFAVFLVSMLVFVGIVSGAPAPLPEPQNGFHEAAETLVNYKIVFSN